MLFFTKHLAENVLSGNETLFGSKKQPKTAKKKKKTGNRKQEVNPFTGSMMNPTTECFCIVKGSEESRKQPSSQGTLKEPLKNLEECTKQHVLYS